MCCSEFGYITKRGIWVVGISLLLLGCTTLGYAAAPTATIKPRKLAEQIYKLLQDRYVVNKYTLDKSGKTVTVTLTLSDGSVLTYNALGRLIRRLAPSGEETHYQKGFPVKILSPRGAVISETKYVWSSQGKIKRAATLQGKRLTTSYYTDAGDIYSETVYLPKGQINRYDYSWSDTREVYTYYETRTWEKGMHMYSVSTVNGLVVEQWRVGDELEQVWEEPYQLCMQLFAERFRNDYSDRTQFKKDSQGLIRGDVMLKNLNPE
jgi:YD repeat-containing protein